MEGPFTYETLSGQESAEKKDRKLTKLEAGFFRYVANYLEQLEIAYRREQEKNPSSKKAAFLVDELRNATNKAEELWKAREKKIVAFAQVDGRRDPPSPPPENLTREESALYQALVGLLKEQWVRLLPQRTGPGQPPSPGRPVVAPAPAPAASANPAPAAASPMPAAPSPATGPDELLTVRALVDIPPFIGFDGKTYRIKKGEVLSLPGKFAKILRDRNQAALVG